MHALKGLQGSVKSFPTDPSLNDKSVCVGLQARTIRFRCCCHIKQHKFVFSRHPRVLLDVLISCFL